MNSQLKFYSIFLTTFLMFFNGISQKVNLIEKQNGKRLELYAQNNDSISYSVFLRVTTSDYRRSSNRPVLSVIAPKTTKHLLTLIKLADKPGNYEKQFIINEVSQKLSIRKDNNNFEINFNDALKTKNIAIYESDNCNICIEAKKILNENKIAFVSNHIITDSITLKKAIKNSKHELSNFEHQSFILQIKDKLYPNIKNKSQLIETLKTIAK